MNFEIIEDPEKAIKKIVDDSVWEDVFMKMSWVYVKVTRRKMSYNKIMKYATKNNIRNGDYFVNIVIKDNVYRYRKEGDDKIVPVENLSTADILTGEVYYHDVKQRGTK